MESSTTPKSLGKIGSARSKKDDVEIYRNYQTVKDMPYVIFPESKWIKRWDLLNLVLILMLVFIIPYQVGVSAGYYIVTKVWWFSINLLIDAIFTIDTFLYFWRAYQDKNGRVIFNLIKIRHRYLRTYFILNLLSNFPANLIIFTYVHTYTRNHSGTYQQIRGSSFILFKVFDVLKFLRFLRLRPIMKQSSVIRDVQQKIPFQLQQLCLFLFLMVSVAHWFACIWCFAAFLQIGDYEGDEVCEVPNWMGNWVTGTYGSCEVPPGGLNPLGWTNDIHRYVLALFWSIQTITSIGYGNIAPFTVVEWWVSSFLMLLSGFLWAYMIGGLVNVAAALQIRHQIYGARVDEANDMVAHFEENDKHDKHDMLSIKSITERNIKKYLHDQYRMSHAASFKSDVSDLFPVYESLPPHLQRVSSLMIFKNCVNSVPYLSSKYLSWDEQALVAQKCSSLEFGAGDVIDLENLKFGELDRGIFVLQRGMAWGFDYYSKNHFKGVLVMSGNAFGHNKVLVENGAARAKAKLKFLTFARITFIPREAVLEALANNSRAWKDCGRWLYLRTMLMGVLGRHKQFFGSRRNEMKSIPRDTGRRLFTGAKSLHPQSNASGGPSHPKVKETLKIETSKTLSVSSKDDADAIENVNDMMPQDIPPEILLLKDNEAVNDDDIKGIKEKFVTFINEVDESKAAVASHFLTSHKAVDNGIKMVAEMASEDKMETAPISASIETMNNNETGESKDV